jgi:class 3 adenylate cyclase
MVEAHNKAQIRNEYEVKALKQQKIRNGIIFASGMILLLAIGLWSRLSYVRKSKLKIEAEKQKSEDLLLHILPSEIAHELKETGTALARNYETVSILFTDFKEFTQASQNMTPMQLVSEIDVCFQYFDSICDKYRIEKIKTIGDSFMACGGLNLSNPDTVANTILAALEMADYIVKRKKEATEKDVIAFEMRAGIHTGQVVAGVVGAKKFQYDVWGDTVNTASRMESSGAVGKVNISATTYEFVKDDRRFQFENRGSIEVKGKGAVEMFFVSLKHN